MEKVPQAGYDIRGLWISGLQRKLTLRNMLFPVKVIGSLIKASRIVSEFKPDLAIGTGGFASGPVLRVAAGKGIPCVLQEQNSYAGITNKLLSKSAARICVAYDGMEQFFPKDKIVKTGNPVRSNLTKRLENTAEAYAYFGLHPQRTTLFILGGSLGSGRINELVENKLRYLATFGIQLIWQCGKLYYDHCKRFASESVKVFAFLDRMDLAYGISDLIISRAGAGAVSELCIVGKPVIFIPSPNVAEDHQTKNAESLVAENAAIMIREKELDTRFEEEFSALFLSMDKRRELELNIKRLALPDATSRIADEIGKVLRNKYNQD